MNLRRITALLVNIRTLIAVVALMAASLSGEVNNAFAQQPPSETLVAKTPGIAASAVTDEAPSWQQLSGSQQDALKPLEKEWPKIDAVRKRKWLSLTAKFSSMSADEQLRVQERMRDWARLTPNQRRLARENYFKTQSLPAAQKSEQWQNYQQLPDDEKRRLATSATPKKLVTRLPSPNQIPNSQILPIKATPKPILEQSIKPKSTNPSPSRPSQSTSAQ